MSRVDSLFAMEGEIGYEDDLTCQETMYTLPSECRSIEDPVFIKPRILQNILSRCSTAASASVDYFKTVQTEVRPHMRKIVSDWMLDVCEEQQCHPEVFHLAMNYVDRVLSQVNIGKHQFQLLGCVCMFLASKFKETCPLPAENLVIYTDNSVAVKDILTWELMILNVLKWDLSAVTPYSILDQLLRSIELRDERLTLEKIRKHSETLVALAATEYAFSHKSPALVAVASLGAALRGLKTSGLDSMLQNLHLTTGVQENVITECMDEIELSIGLSMNGTSFQPQTTQEQAKVPPPAPAVSAPKVIYNQTTTNAGGVSTSTTPTDVMEVSSAYVY